MSAREILRTNAPIQVTSNRPGWISLSVSPTLESREQIAKAFRSHLDELPEGLADALLLAMDELVGNAIEHGCGLDPRRNVDVALVRTDRMILMFVRDDGAGFSMGNVNHAAVNNPPDKPLHHAELRSQLGLRPGGFGIMLARQVADELIYNENGNAVLLIKYLDSSSAHSSMDVSR